MNKLYLFSNIFCLFTFVFFPFAYAYNPVHIEQFNQTHICEGCDFNLLNATPAFLGQSDYSSATLKGSYFYGSAIERLNLQYLDATETTAVGLLLHDNDLRYADFSYSDLSKLKVTAWNKGDYIKFRGSFLKGADFSYTEFVAPDLFEAYLGQASLYRVNWPQANLSGANLQDADLSFAQLRGANLQGTNLSGAVLSRATLTQANLFNAKVTEHQLKQAKSLQGAILPNGEVSP